MGWPKSTRNGDQRPFLPHWTEPSSVAPGRRCSAWLAVAAHQDTGRRSSTGCRCRPSTRRRLERGSARAPSAAFDSLAGWAGGSAAQTGWFSTVNRPLPGIGLALSPPPMLPPNDRDQMPPDHHVRASTPPLTVSLGTLGTSWPKPCLPAHESLRGSRSGHPRARPGQPLGPPGRTA